MKSPVATGRIQPFAAAAASGLLLSFAQAWSIPTISTTVGFILDTPAQGLLAYVALVPLLILLHRETRLDHVLVLAFIATFVYFYSSIYWVNNAIILFGGLHWTISLLAVTILVLYMCGVATALLWAGRWICLRLNWNFLLISPFFWVAHEYVRNYLFTGFPWSQVGYTQAHLLPVLQSASLGGVYFVSMVVLLVNAAVAGVWLWRRGHYQGSVKWLLRYAAATGTLLVALVVFGFIRMYLNDRAEAAAPRLRVAILQGNISQEIKNESTYNREFILDRYVRLNNEAQATRPDLIVWPEASYPSLLPADLKQAGNPMGIDFPLSGHTILGASVMFQDKLPERVLGNSVFLINPLGRVLDRHDKTHLVPFGEYVPMKPLLLRFGVRSIVQAMGVFTQGSAGHLLSFNQDVPGFGSVPVNVGVLICYEGIFPEISRNFANSGSNLLVSITNDAWYGLSSAAPQHLLMYAFRSVEQGRFTLRAANTGISAIIDSSGRIHHASRLFDTTWIHGSASVLTRRTLYAYIGDVFGWLPLLTSGALLVLALLRRQPTQRNQDHASKPTQRTFQSRRR